VKRCKDAHNEANLEALEKKADLLDAHLQRQLERRLRGVVWRRLDAEEDVVLQWVRLLVSGEEHARVLEQLAVRRATS
jgi:hypothetical protein